MKKAKTVDEYIEGFPQSTQEILQQIRASIKSTAPQAEETISYGMPAYKLHGVLVYFASYEKHIGFYATPTGHTQFAKELSGYKQGKGSVQFPLDQPMPLDLIEQIVKFRVEENMSKNQKKKQ
jgi:uncharacterized protein YdhG (YjbR/CyaY superfamily)